jgi:hypothetical protein
MNTPSETQLEAQLVDVIFPDLERGRPKWDMPHTRLVVQRLKELLAADEVPGLDRTVLLIAAYAHDWGYADLFAGKPDIGMDEVKAMKPLHMRLGSEKLAGLLAGPGYSWLEPGRAARAVHLVSVHDNLPTLTDPDELLLMEADTLGGLGGSPENSTFDPDSSERYLRGVLARRLPLFITEYGKRECLLLMDEYRKKFLG